MKKSVLIALLLLLAFVGMAQQRAMVWYFGNEAGVNFSTGIPMALDDGNMVAEAGCATICDSSGNLLFYTNGMSVWNRNHQIMEGGDSLYGSQLLNQNGVIVPKPLSDDSIFYLFTINNKDSVFRFSYSIVNTNKNNDLGEIVKDDSLLINNNGVEKIAATQHCNGLDYWVVTHNNKNSFFTWPVTKDSVGEPVISKVGLNVKADIGYLKISPAGDKLIMPLNNDDVLAQLFDFDNKTGVVSNPVTIFQKHANTYCFGFEFSPDGNILYMSTGGKAFSLWQFDLRNKSEELINQKAIQLAEGNNFALQLAPDKKIYIARENSPYLNVINNPDLAGKSCGYEKKALKLTHGHAYKGLPNFVQSWFYSPSFDVYNTCYGDTTNLVFNHNSNIDSLVWQFIPGEGEPFVNGQLFSVNRLFHDSLNLVLLSAFHCGITDTVSDSIEIVKPLVSTLPDDILLCSRCTIQLDAGEADSWLWNDSSKLRYLDVTVPGVYWVQKAYKSCISVDSVRVIIKNPVVMLPNAFTPNGDGVNDIFQVISQDNLFDFQLWIYNRQGRLLFSTTDIYSGWDGNYNGKPCMLGTYIWKISFGSFNDDGTLIRQTKKGFVTLIK